VNGIILENGADRDVASAVAELQFEDEDDEAYCNKVRQMTSMLLQEFTMLENGMFVFARSDLCFCFSFN
jgi:hypothetical protein